MVDSTHFFYSSSKIKKENDFKGPQNEEENGFQHGFR